MTDVPHPIDSDRLSAQAQANLRLLRDSHEALDRGDFDAFMAGMDSRVRWETNSNRFPGIRDLYTGRDGVSQWLADAYEPWERVRVSLGHVDVIEDDLLLAATRMIARGRSSDVETQLTIWHLFWFSEHQISRRLGPDMTREEGLRAAESSAAAG